MCASTRHETKLQITKLMTRRSIKCIYNSRIFENVRDIVTGLYFFGTDGPSVGFLSRGTSNPDEKDFGTIPNLRHKVNILLRRFTMLDSVAYFKCSVITPSIPGEDPELSFAI